METLSFLLILAFVFVMFFAVIKTGKIISWKILKIERSLFANFWKKL